MCFTKIVMESLFLHFNELYTLVVLIILLSTVLSERVPVDLGLAAAMVLLLVGGIITPDDALDGFSNPAIFIILCFYIVSASVRDSGIFGWFVTHWLGRKSSFTKFLPKLMMPVALISSVMSNTPVVAMFIPLLREWARKNKLSVSKLLIPLSFASILGGVCTLIGTSTNIIVLGLLENTEYQRSLTLFSPAAVGLPIIFLGVAYFAIIGWRLLPDHPAIDISEKNALKKYSLSMRVDEKSSLVGKTIADSGLLDLSYASLVEITTQKKSIISFRSNRRLCAGDILFFLGQPEGISELRQLPGLTQNNDQLSKLDTPTNSRALVEAVLSPKSSMVGRSIKKSMFRTRFGSVIVSVSRKGRVLKTSLNKLRLQAGDLLLMEAPPGFVKLYRNSSEFLLLSRLDGIALPDKSKVRWIVFLLGLYFALVLTSILSIVAASLLLVMSLGITKCISLDQAQRSIDARVILAIGASISIGVAMQASGLADSAVSVLLAIAGDDPYINLVLLYVATVIATELITNNAAAVIMFALAQNICDQLGVNLLPFAIVVMFGASSSFMTPMGYQTNLMVQGPGGYSFKDFFKVGFGLSIIVGATVLTLVPLIWPFY